MFTIFMKYTGNRKGGQYSNYKDWAKVSKAQSEDEALNKIRSFRRVWKNFEFKFECV